MQVQYSSCIHDGRRSVHAACKEPCQLADTGMVVQHFVRKCNRQFLEQARGQQAQLASLPLSARIAKLVRARLELTAQHIGVSYHSNVLQLLLLCGTVERWGVRPAGDD